MISWLANTFCRFSRSEDGNATIEFVITFPVMMFLLLSSADLGMGMLNQSILERAVDITAREIRLDTGTVPQHDEIKTRICARASFIRDCALNLRLEMIQEDPRNWVAPAADADCTDQSLPVSPVRSFVNGQANDLMILRACAKITPLFPTVGIGKDIVKDAAGQYIVVATTAFVQEPL